MNFFIFIIMSSTIWSLFLLSFGDEPTEGFTEITLREENFELQKPYNIPLEKRYSFENGTHRLWVYADDKPHDPNSPTQPRTEIRI
ncbi:hypothetical protein P3S67_012535 [Capsicum chacoense]